ncbi:hypothetical protein GHK52_05800 [Lactococcus garvieae]|nr:hypothetical protein [Lactococcus garvieae]
MKQNIHRENKNLIVNDNEVEEKSMIKLNNNINLYIATPKNKYEKKIFFEEGALLNFLQRNKEWTGRKVEIFVNGNQYLEAAPNIKRNDLDEIEKYNVFKENLKKEYQVYAFQIYLKYTSELLSREVISLIQK